MRIFSFLCFSLCSQLELSFPGSSRVCWSGLKLCLSSCLLSVRQGSDGELRGDKDGMSDSESKVDSGVPEVPVPPDDTPEVLNKALSGLSSRYRHPGRMNVEDGMFYFQNCSVFTQAPQPLCWNYLLPKLMS